MQLKLIIVKTTMTIEKGNREKSQRVSEIERWFAKEVGEKEKGWAVESWHQPK